MVAVTSVPPYIAAAWQSLSALYVSGRVYQAFSAATALSVGCDAIQESHKNPNSEDTSRAWAATLGFAICATNIVPGFATAGAIISLAWGIFFGGDKNASLIYQGIYKVVVTLFLETLVWKGICKTVINVACFLATLLGNIVGRMPFSKSPYWIFPAALVVVIGVYYSGIAAGVATSLL